MHTCRKLCPTKTSTVCNFGKKWIFAAYVFKLLLDESQIFFVLITTYDYFDVLQCVNVLFEKNESIGISVVNVVQRFHVENISRCSDIICNIELFMF